MRMMRMFGAAQGESWALVGQGHPPAAQILPTLVVILIIIVIIIVLNHHS